MVAISGRSGCAACGAEAMQTILYVSLRKKEVEPGRDRPSGSKGASVAPRQYGTSRKAAAGRPPDARHRRRAPDVSAVLPHASGSWPTEVRGQRGVVALCLAERIRSRGRSAGVTSRGARLGSPMNSDNVTSSAPLMRSRRSTAPTVRSRISLPSDIQHRSTYSTSSANFRSQLRLLRPETWARPVSHRVMPSVVGPSVGSVRCGSGLVLGVARRARRGAARGCCASAGLPGPGRATPSTSGSAGS